MNLVKGDALLGDYINVVAPLHLRAPVARYQGSIISNVE
jgi:hypothetical protein